MNAATKNARIPPLKQFHGIKEGERCKIFACCAELCALTDLQFDEYFYVILRLQFYSMSVNLRLIENTDLVFPGRPEVGPIVFIEFFSKLKLK